MQSTVSEPQALSVTDILDTSFRLYRKHFWTYLAIIMIIEIPVLILLGIVASISNNELITFQDFFTFISRNMTQFFFLTNLVTFQPIAALIIILLMLLLQIRIGVLINATAQVYHTGSTSATQAYRVPIVPIIVIGVLGLISTVLSIIPFLPVLLALPFVCVYQIVLLEKPNPFTAIARNWYLIQGSILRIVGLMFLLFILEQVLQAIPSSLFAYMWSLAGLWEILTWVVAAFGYVISLLLLSFSTIVFTLLYFELRARRDGYDLEHKAQQHFARS
ncbi:MAG: hypothetical protein AAGF95_07870 [Chloroflexota bacterium]